ncbi:hypothetical protein [Peptostreptococcus anaerobius]|uniref:hypothetical protein n=1 Tax=Peptostreptococcus anaerobius TaxID=1261 RepID=UPI0002A1E868|nr:hypothetical protein [Peptostreptococcus anaerobius]EKX93381.1 hypothetical protein HMPREF9998_00843 [Peptostreptococcus anaerobius VPI 4330 = DSM 2949]
MKTLIVYFSNHHLNTLKLVEFLDGEVEFDKLELRENRDVSELELDIDQYDRGFICFRCLLWKAC